MTFSHILLLFIFLEFIFDNLVIGPPATDRIMHLCLYKSDFYRVRYFHELHFWLNCISRKIKRFINPLENDSLRGFFVLSHLGYLLYAQSEISEDKISLVYYTDVFVLWMNSICMWKYVESMLNLWFVIIINFNSCSWVNKWEFHTVLLQ